MAFGAAYLIYQHLMTTPQSELTEVVQVTMNPGTTYPTAIDRLIEHKLVSYPRLFDLRSRQRNKRVPLIAGMYKIKRNLSADQMMDKLAKGPDVLLQDLPLRFRLDPGENIFKAAKKLKKLGVEGSLLDLARNPIKVQNLGVVLPVNLPVNTYTALEGYLYPDTYYLSRKKPRVIDAVRRAVRRFNAVWNKVRLEYAASYAQIRSRYGLSDYQLITLASLVEKEVVVSDEAAVVAGVFYNRLRIGQKLQTDPTMIYSPTTWQDKPSPAYRRSKKNPYNTYQINGLPPGPIANPGRNALIAVVAPAITDAIYFVAKRDGSGRHVFSSTLSEHKRNINRYLKGGN